MYAQQNVGSQFRVNSYTTSGQWAPSVASFSDDNFVVTWQSFRQDGSSWGIFGQLFDGNGIQIGSEFRANSYTPGDQDSPSVASFSNGNFVVTWESDDQDGSGSGIYGQLFNGNGAKIGNEFQVHSNTTGAQYSPAVASLPDDNFVVTWNKDSSFGGVYGQLFNGNGTKIGNEFQANTYTTSNWLASSVESFSNGNFVVIWQMSGQDASSNGVYGQLFDGNGSKIGSKFQVNASPQRAQKLSSASFTNGNFVVTWMSSDGSSYGVYGQLFDGNGTKIGSEFQVNSYTTDHQDFPAVTSFSNGNFVVTWQSDGQDGDGFGIYGQLFNGNSSKIGSEFQVNTYTAEWQRFPSVASFSNGNFVVTWESGEIYGQIFTSSTPISSISLSTNFYQNIFLNG